MTLHNSKSKQAWKGLGMSQLIIKLHDDKCRFLTSNICIEITEKHEKLNFSLSLTKMQRLQERVENRVINFTLIRDTHRTLTKESERVTTDVIGKSISSI